MRWNPGLNPQNPTPGPPGKPPPLAQVGRNETHSAGGARPTGKYCRGCGMGGNICRWLAGGAANIAGMGRGAGWAGRADGGMARVEGAGTGRAIG